MAAGGQALRVATERAGQVAEVPVAVPCNVRAVERPVWALDQVDSAADVFTKGRAALVEVGQRAAYEIRLEAAVAACQWWIRRKAGSVVRGPRAGGQ